MIIESLNIAEMRALRGRDDDDDDASWLRYEIVFRATFMRLKEAGAELGIIEQYPAHEMAGHHRRTGFTGREHSRRDRRGCSRRRRTARIDPRHAGYDEE